MTYDLMLNMSKSGIKPRIKVSQYDNEIPQLRITLFDQNQSYAIPSGATVYISGTKKDNTGFQYECTVNDNIITAPITNQMTVFSGDVECEINIVTLGGKKSTENFILEVEKSALEDDVIISETDIPAIQRLSQPASTTQLGVVKVDGTSITVDEDGTIHTQGGGAVQSVNGKTGEVELDADDIDDSETTNKFVTATEKNTWNGKADTNDIPTNLSDLDDDTTHRVVTDTEKSTWNGKSVVSVTQIKSSGEKIATINVNGTDTDLYASAGGGGGGAVDSVNGMTGDVVLDVDDINDVDINNLADGQTLVYDATSGKWVNGSGGGGTSDYTDLTNKPQINGVTLSGNKTSGDLNLQSALTFTSTPSESNKVVCLNDLSSGGSNRNLFDNPWFTVNQKGFSSGSGSQIGETTPFIDRWIGYWRNNSSSIISLSNNRLSFEISSGVEQGINQKSELLDELSEGIATISVLFDDNTVMFRTFDVSAHIMVDIGQKDGMNIHYRHYSDINTHSISFENISNETKTITIKAVKLEIGSISTLAYDTEPNYELELVKCGNGITCCWENTSPTTAFAGQTIQFNLNKKFRRFLVLCDGGVTANVQIGTAMYLQRVNMSTSSGIFLRYDRGITISNSGNTYSAVFDDATKYSFSTYGSTPTSETSNDNLIPIAIYGI